MKVYFETFGCTSNRADTEIMEGIVGGSHEVVEVIDDCDVAVINSCAVVGYTQRKVEKRVIQVKSIGKKVVLAGCLTKIDPKSLTVCNPDCAISPDSINLINHAVEAVAAGRSFQHVPQYLDKAAIKRRITGSVIAAIPIAEGCRGRCSYCATRFSRGSLRSFPVESIMGAVEFAVSSGCREVQLTAQDTGQYGRDIGRNLAELITRVSTLEGDFRIRVGMMNPSFIVNACSELITAFQNEKVYKFLHLPIQSGDDSVLKNMRRGYTAHDFTRIVEGFRKELPELTVATDVIVGYPTESEASFFTTYKLIEDIIPDILNITRFSPRPNTSAERLKDLQDSVKKERSRKISLLARNISGGKNKGYIGRVEDVLITEQGKESTLLGRTSSYKQVVLRSGKLGEFKKIRIRGATPHYLET